MNRVENTSPHPQRHVDRSLSLRRLEQSRLKKTLTIMEARSRAFDQNIIEDSAPIEDSKQRDFPLWKKAIAVPALGLSLISACADNTVDSTTTNPPTTIKSTTTVPTTTLPETTTTTLPKPTTTTTTVPETTTRPAILYTAEGRMKVNGSVLELGYWKKEVDNENVYEIVTGNLLNISNRTIEFTEYDKVTGELINNFKDVAVLTIAFGNYDSDINKPLIRDLWFGRTDMGYNRMDGVVYTSLSGSDVLAGGLSIGGIPINDLVDELQLYLSQNPQIIIYVPTFFRDDYIKPCADFNPQLMELPGACEVGLTGLDYLNNNNLLVEDILNLKTPGYTPKSTNKDLGWFERIITYTR